MAFQIDEKLMAHNRAITTRNLKESDINRNGTITHKPGMTHYISENRKLMLSVDPITNPDKTVKSLYEIITDTRLDSILLNYVNRAGGTANSIRGQIVSTLANGTAPLSIVSTTKVANLNVDRVDDMHVDLTAIPSTIVGRTSAGDIAIKNNLHFDDSKVVSSAGNIKFLNRSDVPVNITSNEVISKAGKLIATNQTTQGNIEWDGFIWKVGPNGNTSEIVTKSLYGTGKGIDADKVDGRNVDDTKSDTNNLWTAKKTIDATAPSGFGIGERVTAIKDNNCNNVIGTGFFSGSSPSNGATGETGLALLQSYSDGTNIYQTVEYITTKNIYTRYKINGVWSIWNKVMTKENVLDESLDIILGSTQPVGVINENTYWYEII